MNCDHVSYRVRCVLLVWLFASVSGGCGLDAPAAEEPALVESELIFDADGARAQKAGLLVKIRSGLVRGRLVGETREFLGIPYAKTTAGQRRFTPAEPVAPWRGVRDALEFGPSCPQQPGGLAPTNPQSEDCLSLNVYAPRASRHKRQVMVFIHGGAFIAGGSSQYDGKRLSEEGDLIVVTLNYRVGALGLLRLPELDPARGGVPSGNDAFRDQIVALEWVRANIAAFGGDPRDILLFGESAGSMSTCLHLVSPLSEQLADRFIMQSATCVQGLPILTEPQARAIGEELAEFFCAGQADVVTCLREVPAAELVAFGADRGISGAGWAPVVNPDDPFLPVHPRQFIASGDYNKGPFIVGSNAREWGLFQALGAPLIPTVAAFNAAVAAQFGPIAPLVQAQYQPSSDAEANPAFVRLMTDFLFRCPARTLARLATAQGSTAYLYHFEWELAYHAFELPYVFGNPNPRLGAPTLAEPLRHDIQTYWTTFAWQGNPNSRGLLFWPRYTTATDQHMALTIPTAVGTGLSKADCDFWDSVTPP